MLSRRKFIKVCVAAMGLTAAGGWNLHKAWAGGAAEQGDVADRALPAGNGYIPGYLRLEQSGELERRERALWDKMESCDLCPRLCRVNRMAGRTGACSSDHTFRVASAGPHFGEERPLVGRGGSGTIFFSNCNLLCVFCQNWTIAHRGDGRVTTHAQLADTMISLQNRGCHNINLVTPTHLTPHIVTALRLAINRGLNIPLLYNTSGYETMEVMRLLDGVVDVYLPDFKYQDSAVAARFSQGAPDYVRHTAAAISDMHRQVGTLSTSGGIAYRGLLIRHLVMPENLAGTDVFVRWVARELGTDTHVNIMAQYSPQFRAREFPEINRRISQNEFNQAMRWAREAGLRNFH